MSLPHFLSAPLLLALAAPAVAKDPPGPPAPKAPIQFRVESKIIQGPAAVIPHGKIVTPAIAKARLTEISGEDGWDVLSAPSVVTLEGHDATVEIGKELIFAAGDEPKFVGLKVLLHLESAGGGAILTKVHAVLTAASGEKGDSAPVLTFEQKLESLVVPGHTLSLVVPTNEPGQLTTFLVTPTSITPDEKPK